MISYVLGFCFDNPIAATARVLLIQKNKPEFQKGKRNGIGGKIEAGETARDAMVREFYEETGVKTDPFRWSKVGTFGGDDWKVYVFSIIDSSAVSKAYSKTDEQVSPHLVAAILYSQSILPNLRALIPLALAQEILSLNTMGGLNLGVSTISDFSTVCDLCQ